MNLQTSQHPTAISSALAEHFQSSSPRPVIVTVAQFAERNPAFTTAAVRNLVFKAAPRQSSLGEIPGNGLAESGALIRLGRRVLIEENLFLRWVAQAGAR